MDDLGIALAVIGSVLFYAVIDVLLGWLLYRWCIKFTPYSRTATTR